ncbi:MFS general substrate transporter [Podospora aff. communis PSN243]|uniref:MFS general substrate transporter n=1 Tax=Podospora aff. communis PSN243 TaxID=3040156 RepID=A0AAV9GFQ0_9PEZI|nr:MFS general substrate transporter [Podospora aff. communis PSN243]
MSSITTTTSHEAASLSPKDGHPGTPPTAPVTTAGLDWAGPDDAANPQNWSLAKKSLHVVVPSFFCLSVTMASSLYVAAVPDLTTTFAISETAALLGLSLYVAGLAFGPILAAPISETLGRRAVYRVTLVLFSLFVAGAGSSRTFASLVVCRFFAGFFGGSVLSVISGTNADIWTPLTRAPSAAAMALSTAMGPSIGPIIGGFLVEDGRLDWRWTQWVVLMFAAVTGVGLLTQSETYKKTILVQRAKQGAKGGSNKATPSPPPLAARLRLLLVVTLTRPLRMLASEPIVFFLSLYSAFTVALLFVFFSAYPMAFSRQYGFAPHQIGLTFLAICIGCILGSALHVLLDRTVYRPLVHASLARGQKGLIPPEHRLYSAMAGGFGIPIGLLMFGWGAEFRLNWVVLVLGGIPVGFGVILLFLSSAMYLVDTYAQATAASALAANGFLRYVLSAALPLATPAMFKNLGIGWASTVLAIISVAMLPIPWILFRYGPRIRSRSRFETTLFDSEKPLV